MKKFLAVLTLLFVACTSIGIFTACEGEELPHQHEYSEIYKKDNTYHWYECSCGEDKGKEEHAFTNNVCVCGYEKTETHVHEYADIYSYNTESHWFECDCGEKKAESLHQLVDNICVCGYEKIEVHTHIFNKKVVLSKYKKSSATCTEKAKYYLSCECEERGTETFEVGEPLEHAYGDWQSNNDGTHSKICANDNKHKITEKCSGGTATEENRPVCSVCSSEYGAVLGHVHSFTEQNPTDKFLVSEATCLKKAVYNKSCSCGEEGEATFEYGELDSHDIGTVTKIILGTEDDTVEPGDYCVLTIGICKICGLSASEYDREHDYAETVKAPTCIEDGFTIDVCSKCGYETNRRDVVPALDHDYYDINIFKYHNTARDVCTNGGFTIKACQREGCGFAKDPEYVEPTGHHSNNWEIKIEPTGQTTGVIIGDCNVCYKVCTTRDLPKLGADYNYYLDNENRPFGKENYDNYTYSIIIDGQVFKFGELVGHLCGDKRIVGDAYIDDFTYLKYPEIKVFINQEISSEYYSGAYFTCKGCGENIAVNVKKASNSVYSSLNEEYPKSSVYTYVNDNGNNLTVEITKPATCLEAGEKVYTYVDKNGVKTEIKEVIPKLNHLYAKEGDVETRLDDTVVYEYGDYDFNYFGNIAIGCGESASAWFVCLDCGDPVAVNVIKPHVEPEDPADYTADVASTCEVAGYYEFTCDRCGDKNARVNREKLNHNYKYTISNGTQSGTKKITGICTNDCCVYSSAYCHCVDWKVIYDNCEVVAKTVKQATCNQSGQIEYTLILEGVDVVTLYEEIAITAHQYNGADIDEVNAYLSNTAGLVKLGNQPANCMGEGGGYFVCDMCDDPIFVKVQGPHTGKFNVVSHSATCTSDSFTTFDCSVCSKTNIMETGIKAYGHVYSYEITVLPTAYSTGKVVITCEQNKCDCNFLVERILPTLNSENYEFNCIEPSCEKEGKNMYTIQVLGDGTDMVTVEYLEILDTIAHDYTDTRAFSYTHKDGVERTYTIKYCEDCKYWIIWSIEPDLV